MSDFLTNLTARTLEAAPLLQPRPLSRFEPSPFAAPRAVLDVQARTDELAAANDEAGLEAAEEIAPPTSTRLNRRPRRPTLSTNPSALAAKFADEDNLTDRLNYMPQTEPPRPALDYSLNQPAPSPRHPAPLLAPDTQAIFNSATERSENRQSLNQPDIKQNVAPSVQLENQPPVAPPTLSEVAQPAPPTAKPPTKAAPKLSFVTPVVAPAIQPLIVEDYSQIQARPQTQATRPAPKSIVERFAERLAADAQAESQSQRRKDPNKVEDEQGTMRHQPRGVRVEPAVISYEPRTTSQEQSVRDATAATSAPTINVTIGRIEVRATQPASQPSRAASSRQPGMSLEEYLQQRNNRQRGGEFR